MIPLAIALVVGAAVHGGDTLAPGQQLIFVGGGLMIGGLPAPGQAPTLAEVLPLPTLDFEYGRGLTRAIDLRLRLHTTAVGLNTVGPVLRACLLSSGMWAVGARLTLDAQVYGVPYSGGLVGGALGSAQVVSVTMRGSRRALTVELGASEGWVAVSSMPGRVRVDTRPRFDDVRIALSAEWSRSGGRTFEVRADLGIPLAREPALALGGFYPGVTVGGSWSF